MYVNDLIFIYKKICCNSCQLAVKKKAKRLSSDFPSQMRQFVGGVTQNRILHPIPGLKSYLCNGLKDLELFCCQKLEEVDAIVSGMGGQV